MSALSWYLCLAAIGLAAAVFVIYKKRHTYKLSTLIVFYLFATCITWFGEFLALSVFKGYSYKPGVFADPWADSYVGHMVLNSTLWPGAAFLIISFARGYIGISLITAFFIFAEYLFSTLGIYEQHWWRYYMSAIIVVAYLLISKRWFEKIKDAKERISRILTFYFVGYLIIHTPSVLLMFSGKQYHSFSIFENIVRNTYWASAVFAGVYHLIEALFLVLFVCILKKKQWKLVPFAITFVGQSILANTGILVFHGGWKLVYTIIIYSMSLVVFILFEKYTLKPGKKMS